MLALGNPRAIASSTRGSEPYADLNRVFTDARLADAAETSYEMQRARELAPLLASADYLVDLHATNKPSEAFLVVAGDTPKHRELCRFFACEKILHVPETVVSGTTVGLVDRHRGAGICFESGWLGDLSRVGEMRRSVEAILRHAGLLAPAGAPALQDGQRLFVLTGAITLTGAGFAFAEGRGQRSFEPFAAGDLLGHHGAAHRPLRRYPHVPESPRALEGRLPGRLPRPRRHVVSSGCAAGGSRAPPMWPSVPNQATASAVVFKPEGDASARARAVLAPSRMRAVHGAARTTNPRDRFSCCDWRPSPGRVIIVSMIHRFNFERRRGRPASR